MSFWTTENLREILGGRWLNRRVDPPNSPPPPPLSGVNTDTRSLRRGEVFLALRGDRFDGHDFVEAAADAGSPLLIVDRAEAGDRVAEGRCDMLLVNDTQRALSHLAAVYRRRLTGRVIGVTGSVGKTTTKQLIDAVLRPHMRGTASPKSFNNHIGVPLTLLNARPSDEYTVVEIGTNAPGEIAALAKIAAPDIAVITHVGAAHLEGLGSLDAVLREKASLLSHLNNGGVGIINGDIEGLRPYRNVVRSILSFGTTPGCDLRLTDYQPDAEGTRFTVNGRHHYPLPMLGRHNAINALAAIAVARHMNLNEAQVAEALAGAEPPQMRLQARALGHGDFRVTVLDDSYNANPDSMEAAIEVLVTHPAPRRRVAVLGDMLELGDEAAKRHRRLGEQVAAAELDVAIFVGRLSLFAAHAAWRQMPAERVFAFPGWSESDDVLDEVAGIIQPGDTVLLKGSRGMRLERLIERIEGRLPGGCGTAAG